MEAKRHIEPHQATFLMVGCKKDLARTEREVPKETAQVVILKSSSSSVWKISHLELLLQALADYHGIPFLETSAKTGENVEEAFSLISQAIYDKVERGEYKIEEGWDGIKAGFLQRPGGAGQVNCVMATQLGSNCHKILQGGLVEAQPTNGGCC